MTTVAVLGTGLMGSAIARRLTERGFTVRAWNRSAEKVEPLAAAGVTPAASVEGAVRDADVVITMVPTGDVVAELARRFLPVMPRHAVWLQTSTVGGEWTDRLLELAANAGRAMLDSPVSGSNELAASGRLTLIVSGLLDALRTVKPVMDALGARTLWVGTDGEASRVKLIVNGWMTASVTAMADTIDACRSLGVDPTSVLDVLRGGPLAMPYALQKADEMRKHEYPPGFPVELALKDVRLLTDELGHPTLVLPAVRKALGEAIRTGHDREDVAAVAELP